MIPLLCIKGTLYRHNKWQICAFVTGAKIIYHLWREMLVPFCLLCFLEVWKKIPRRKGHNEWKQYKPTLHWWNNQPSVDCHSQSSEDYIEPHPLSSATLCKGFYTYAYVLYFFLIVYYSSTCLQQPSFFPPVLFVVPKWLWEYRNRLKR